jgi:hypothetical protein
MKKNKYKYFLILTFFLFTISYSNSKTFKLTDTLISKTVTNVNLDTLNKQDVLLNIIKLQNTKLDSIINKKKEK